MSGTRRDHEMHCTHMERRVTALETRADHIEQKMDTDKTEIIKAGEERARGINERVDTVLRAVSRVEGAIEEMRTHRL